LLQHFFLGKQEGRAPTRIKFKAAKRGPKSIYRDEVEQSSAVQETKKGSDEDITSTHTTTPPTVIVPSILPPEARPAIHKFYTRRDQNVLLIRNLGVEDKDI
jgi:hypothetical protein